MYVCMYVCMYMYIIYLLIQSLINFIHLFISFCLLCVCQSEEGDEPDTGGRPAYWYGIHIPVRQPNLSKRQRGGGGQQQDSVTRATV